jgi:hypothetical protein
MKKLKIAFYFVEKGTPWGRTVRFRQEHFPGLARFYFFRYSGVHDSQRTAGHNNVPVDIEKLNAILANWINTPNEMHPPNLLSASEREITRRVACPETCFWCSPNEFFIVAAGGGRWAPSPGPRRFIACRAILYRNL